LENSFTCQIKSLKKSEIQRDKLRKVNFATWKTPFLLQTLPQRAQSKSEAALVIASSKLGFRMASLERIFSLVVTLTKRSTLRQSWLANWSLILQLCQLVIFLKSEKRESTFQVARRLELLSPELSTRDLMSC